MLEKITQTELKTLLDYNTNNGLFTWKIRTDIDGCYGKSINTRLAGKTAGHINKRGYCEISINKKKYSAHRLAWLYVYGEWPKDEIDHINEIKSDNKISNLREATSSENKQNRRNPKRQNKSGLLGVYWYEPDKIFRAQIKLNKKNKQLGSFKTKEQAHAAYLAAKKLHHPFSEI